MTTFKSFMQQYPNDDACLEHLMNIRFGITHHCQNCDRKSTHYRITKRQCYSCEWCGHHVYPKAGTPFEKSRTSLHSWFFAIYLFTVSRNGVSAKELQRQLGVTYKTAWRMARLIRAHMGDANTIPPLGKPNTSVEIDIGYAGTKHQRAPLLGIAERQGNIVVRRVKNRAEISTIPYVLEHVSPGVTVASDKERGFGDLVHYGYDHETINKAKGFYTDGNTHTNTVEAFWSLFKNACQGTYIHISSKYVDNYVSEFEFRWNHRHTPELMLPILLHNFTSGIVRIDSTPTHG